MNVINKNKAVIIIIALALFLEFFVFNFRYFESIGYKEISLTEFSYGDGIQPLKDNRIKILNSGEKSIEFENINEEIKNVFIDAKRFDSDIIKNKRDYEKEKLNVVLGITDKANKLYYNLNERSIVSTVDRSKYISLNLSGKSEKLRISFENANDEIIILNKIAINTNIPYNISILRLIIVTAIMLLIYILRPKSGIYKIRFDYKSKKQLGIIIMIFILHIPLFGALVASNPVFVNPPYTHHYQYANLAEALLDGHFYLDEEPSEALKNMENPYDSNYRNQVMKETKSRALWDHAYFEGKYYVYFGITPVLIFYMPFKLLTGLNFPTCVGIFILSLFFASGVFMLTRELAKKYFKFVAFAAYLMLSELIVLSTGVLFAAKRPDFYYMPILMGLTFSAWGLYFWFSAIKEKNLDDEKDSSDYELSASRLCIGSVFMALVAGCRPQLLMGSFLAIPIFYDFVFKKRLLFSKKSIKETFLFCLPYVIFAAFLMYYNYSRFGSPFDFGANYNITTNDMTARGFVFGRTFTGLFMYLFQPPVYSPKFPFISSVYFYTNYMGVTIKELMFGGILFNHPLLLSTAFTFKIKEPLKKKGLFGFVICAVLFTVIIVIADTQMAGLLQRYMSDFSWLIHIAMFIVVLTILEKFEKEKYINYGYALVAVCFGISMFYNFASMFFLGDSATNDKNPEFFYNVMHTVQFWL